jgi:hypothetical protein
LYFSFSHCNLCKPSWIEKFSWFLFSTRYLYFIYYCILCRIVFVRSQHRIKLAKLSRSFFC